MKNRQILGFFSFMLLFNGAAQLLAMEHPEAEVGFLGRSKDPEIRRAAQLYGIATNKLEKEMSARLGEPCRLSFSSETIFKRLFELGPLTPAELERQFKAQDGTDCRGCEAFKALTGDEACPRVTASLALAQYLNKKLGQLTEESRMRREKRQAAAEEKAEAAEAAIQAEFLERCAAPKSKKPRT